MKAYQENAHTPEEIEKAIDELLKKMTIDEKIGQLYQSVGADITAIGSTDVKLDVETLIREGRVGSMIQVDEPKKLALKIKRLQEIAVNESRLGIPLMFCQDVIHGFETVFPIPLAASCSFDTDLIKKAVEIAAKEATKAGIDLAFSPMVDIMRDPRWGRVCEGAGEDPYLGAMIAKAQVEGLRNGGLLSCLKHYLGYGACEAGRDYNTVELSPSTIFNTYLKPFKAGIDAGADSVMTAFNVIDGIPMVCNKKYVKDLLRDKIGFDGIVISDYGAFMETLAHGVASGPEEAATRVFDATVDIEMTTNYFMSELPSLIKRGIVSEEMLDSSAKRVLRKKYECGLMKDPFLHLRPEKIDSEIFSKENRELSLRLALESAVLLENSGILPLLDKEKSIALLGPFATSKDHAGAWTFSHFRDKTISIEEGLRTLGYSNLAVENATDIFEEESGGIKRATKKAKNADVAIICVGESSIISGEACSRQDITIPKVQRKLIDEVLKLNKPVVLVVVSGRPLILNEYKDKVDAILWAWNLGSMAGLAIAKLLIGEENPSGKLTITMPYSIGQIPVYYNSLNTGRPAIDANNHFESKYLDGPNEGLYCFGHGMGYTTFELSSFDVDPVVDREKGITGSIYVENTGDREGDVIIQVYIRDKVALISRPIKELKAFKRIKLKAGEREKFDFTIPTSELGFYDGDFNYYTEPGEFEVFAGLDSKHLLNKKSVVLR